MTRQVSPAHAGMDPWVRRNRPSCNGLPRPRGDGPLPPGFIVSADTSPPPTRGWTPRVGPHASRAAVSPAHAGMDPAGVRRRRWVRRLPRPRGDGPRHSGTVSSSRASPPPTRGWTPLVAGARVVAEVSPAHAGMDPRPTRGEGGGMSLPRPRGDGPFPAHSRLAEWMSPPPTRGWTRRTRPRRRARRVSPAHAGMDPGARSGASGSMCLPRPRGDGPSMPTNRRPSSMSPPPTRGWTRELDVLLHGALVSPAHAGMDPRPARQRRGAGRLPRPRGDGPPSAQAVEIAQRSPPPTRGWTPGVRHQQGDETVSPAHAGMDPTRR